MSRHGLNFKSKDWSYEKQLAMELHDLLEFVDKDDTPILDGVRPDTYENCGMMSYNQGLRLRLADGGEYQVTIVCSRQPEMLRCDECMQICDVNGVCENQDCADFGREEVPEDDEPADLEDARCQKCGFVNGCNCEVTDERVQ